MSEQNALFKDERVQTQIWKEHADAIKALAAEIHDRKKMKVSFVQLVNAAIALGLPELKKQNGAS